MGYYTTGFDLSAGTSNQHTRKAWDTLLHEQVRNKLAFKGLIGQDKAGEGSLDAPVSNMPIVEKTNLTKEAGDRITMQLLKQLNGGSTWYNTGVTGNTQLVDSEQGLTFHNVKVLIGHYRDGVKINGMITEQRSPFDLRMAAQDALSTKLAAHLDRSTVWTYYMKYCPSVVRELGHAVAVPTTHPNILYGHGKANLAAMGVDDVLDTDFLERARVFLGTENINPCMEGNFILLAHPLNTKTLRADSDWFDAQAQGMPRGESNPIFQNAIGMWGGIVVRESNLVDVANDYDGITASSDVLTIPTETVPTGAYTDYRLCILTGANAIARAYGKRSYMNRRKEDDYENLIGFGGGFIYGDIRADWAANADNGTDGTKVNQSSAILYTYAPSLSLPTTW